MFWSLGIILLLCVKVSEHAFKKKKKLNKYIFNVNLCTILASHNSKLFFINICLNVIYVYFIYYTSTVCVFYLLYRAPWEIRTNRF